MLIDYLKVSFLMMRARPVRAILSLLGIYIGVMALAVILSIREGIHEQVRDLYRTSGAQVIFIYPGFDPATQQLGRLTLDQLQVLRETPGVIAAIPRLTAEYDAQTTMGLDHAHVIGIDEGFMPVYRGTLQRGRFFIPEEVRTRQPVCLLTQEASAKLFPGHNPVGAYIQMQGLSYVVVGVVRWDPAIALRTSVSDAEIFVPYGWLLGQTDQFIGLGEVRLHQELTADQALKIVKSVISGGDPHREATFIIRSMDEYAKKNEEGFEKVLTALMAIAFISLLVGGVGVANVMLTNVTERTREVGIRKALGARHRDILMQFLVESSLLSGVGGVLAVVTGVAGIETVQALTTPPFPMNPTVFSMGACVVLTLLIGIIAGVYPASRAAALSPADALRNE